MWAGCCLAMAAARAVRKADRGQNGTWIGSCANVVTEEWHFQHDRGATACRDGAGTHPSNSPITRSAISRPMPQRFQRDRCRARSKARTIWSSASAERACRSIASPISATSCWRSFRPTQPMFELFEDIIVSGRKASQSLNRASTKSSKKRSGRSGARPVLHRRQSRQYRSGCKAAAGTRISSPMPPRSTSLQLQARASWIEIVTVADSG